MKNPIIIILLLIFPLISYGMDKVKITKTSEKNYIDNKLKELKNEIINERESYYKLYEKLSEEKEEKILNDVKNLKTIGAVVLIVLTILGWIFGNNFISNSVKEQIKEKSKTEIDRYLKIELSYNLDKKLKEVDFMLEQYKNYLVQLHNLGEDIHFHTPHSDDFEDKIYEFEELLPKLKSDKKDYSYLDWLIIGNAKFFKENYSDALDYMTESIKKKKTPKGLSDRASVYNELGKLETNKKQQKKYFDKSLEDFRESLDMKNGNYAQGFNDMAYLYLDMGDVDSARSNFNKAVEDGFPNPHRGLSLIFIIEEKYSEALSEINKAYNSSINLSDKMKSLTICIKYILEKKCSKDITDSINFLENFLNNSDNNDYLKNMLYSYLVNRKGVRDAFVDFIKGELKTLGLKL